MNTYTINVCVDTKTTDLYDKVAVNKFPLLITCQDDERLKYILNDHDIKLYVKNLISERLYNTAKYHIIRIREGDTYFEDDKIIWDVKDITQIEY